MTDPVTTLRTARRRFGQSTFGKLLTLTLLVLLLLIPVARVVALVQERMNRQTEVEHEIAETWGTSQTLFGPMVTVPTTRTFNQIVSEKEVSVRDPSGRVHPGMATYPAPQAVVLSRHLVHHLPTEVIWQGTVTPEIRYRGLFEVVVYEARLRASGAFEVPRIDDALVPEWDGAALVIGLPDIRGLQQRASLAWGDSEIEFLPGAGETELVGQAIHAPLPDLAELSPGETVPFEFELVLRGSGDLAFLPAGEETQVELSSSWASPGFTGSFLPAEREIGAEGFTASWEVPYFGRSFPQSWLDEDVDFGELARSSFGVSLVLPADGYQQTERSVKYAVLFILLTFGTFFLLEVLSPARLHAMHYLLVGAALVLFYVLLLALSEHLGFSPAYGVAAAATVALIGGYSRSILASRRFAGMVFACLTLLYGYLYVLLRLEDYSLLLGSLGLFAALAAVMRLTRKLDWFNLRDERPVDNG